MDLLQKLTEENRASQNRILSGDDIIPATEALNLPSWLDAGVFLWGSVNKKGFRSLRGVSESSIKNIILILDNDQQAPKPFYDEFSEMLMFTNDKGQYTPWDDTNDTALKFYIEDRYNYTPTANVIKAGVKYYSTTRDRRNLIQERIESVKWDGVNRLENIFIDFLGASNSWYTKEITKRWFVGIIKRAYNPGCKFELVPVLYGGQGIGKSDLVRSIFPNSFVDNLVGMSAKNKDDLQKLNSKMIAEIGELRAFNTSNTDDIKNFTSSQNDNYRTPYDTIPKDHPRKTVFIGTTNKTTFLKDNTGERRFYPIKCKGGIVTKNPHQVEDAYMLQVLAEAKTLYEAGYKAYVENDNKEDIELVRIAEQKQAETSEHSMVEDELEDYLGSTTPPEYAANYFRYVIEDKRKIYERSIKEAPKNWVPIPFVTTLDIWGVGFGNDRSMTTRGKASDSKTINDLMANNPEWANVQWFNGTYKRGFMRKDDI